MGEVLPFIAKVRASGDWTASERASLGRLAQQFADHGLGVEAVFGVTEEGDPWCVVKDADEEVLVHVARIEGRFVIHYAASDTIDEGVDLHDAIAQRLGETADAFGTAAGEKVVVDGMFDRNRQAQILAALLIVAAFFYDTQDAHAAALEAPAPQPTPEPQVGVVAAPTKSDAGSRQDRDSVAHGAALIDHATSQVLAVSAPHSEAPAAVAQAPIHSILPVAETVERAPMPAPSAAAAPVVQAQAAPILNLVEGTAGDDHLVGTAGADLLRGGEGDDLLDGGGAQAGQFDVLDGGAGDDTLLVTAQTIAIGGAGADTFVLRLPTPAEAAAVATALRSADGPPLPPPHPGAPNGEQTFLGVIADFDGRQGDRVVNSRGETVELRQHIEASLAQGGTAFAANSNTTLTTVFGFTGHRVDVDLDKDGRVDGYVIMGGQLPPQLIGGAALDVHDALVTLIGQRVAASNDDFGG